MAGQTEQLPEFIGEISHKTLDRFMTEFYEWAELPQVGDLPDGSPQRVRALRLVGTRTSEAVETFVSQHNTERDNKMAAGEYDQAVGVMGSALARAGEIFAGDELTMARVQALRGAGHVHHTRASTEKELDAAHIDLLNAGLSYIAADKEVGYITPRMAERMWEATLSPAFKPLNEMAQEICFGPGVRLMVVSRNDKAGVAMVDDLKRKAMAHGLEPDETPGQMIIRRSDLPNLGDN